MGGLMNGQCTRLAKTFTTIAALKWFVFGMNVFVVPEMVLPSKCFSTNITWKWSFVGVSTFMDLQIIAFGKIAFAILANKLFFRPCSIGSSHFNWAKCCSTSRMHTARKPSMRKMLMLMLIECSTSEPLIHKHGRM